MKACPALTVVVFHTLTDTTQSLCQTLPRVLGLKKMMSLVFDTKTSHQEGCRCLILTHKGLICMFIARINLYLCVAF